MVLKSFNLRMEIVIKLCIHGVVMAVLFSSVVSASKSKDVSCVVLMVWVEYFGSSVDPAMDVCPLLPECRDSEVNFVWSRNF